MGEVLTKIAIIVSGVSTAMVGFLSAKAATLMVIVGLALSFFRDHFLRTHGRWMRVTGELRMLPTFGVMWVLSVVLWYPFIAFMSLPGTFLTPMQTMFGACLTAAGVRIVAIAAETLTQWLHIWFIDPLWDRVTEEWQDNTTSSSFPLIPSEPHYTAFVPPPYWRFRCPACGARVEHRKGVCWNCNYGADGDSSAYYQAMGQTPPAPNQARGQNHV